MDSYARNSNGSRPFQPNLFGDVDALVWTAERQKQGDKSIVEKLLKVRRSLDVFENNYLTQINDCIDKIRAISKLTEHQREQVILYAIEHQGATTPTEIAEDSRLAIDVVKKTLGDLHNKGLVYQVKKYIPGSDRPYFMLKSKRLLVPEAD